jgi:23S rRNA (cytosine1962-C5)-methyltransferase
MTISEAGIDAPLILRSDVGFWPAMRHSQAEAQTVDFTAERISRKGDDFSVANASKQDYELLDFGGGRKLERFGAVVLDRPSAAAEGRAKSSPESWRQATARYDRTTEDDGVWTPRDALPRQWTIRFEVASSASRDVAGRTPATTATVARQCPAATTCDEPSVALTFQLHASPFGHVGVFPEQYDNWIWTARQVRRAQAALGRSARVLNLFAYTGGSTLAAAAVGAEVTHIDAARNMVERARRNAELSFLGDRPVRWIVEDAMKFCRRELKRGNQYDGVILDPPSYGHGPKGEPWKLEQQLLPLLRICSELTAERLAFVLATCHTPAIGPAELAAYLSDGIFGRCSEPPEAGELFLEAPHGRRLPSGVCARWPA